MKQMYMLGFAMLMAVLACEAGGVVLPCRHSGDYTSIYMYLSTNIVITKSTPDDGKKPVTTFQIGKAHFLNRPEAAISTGDVMDDLIISSAMRVGSSEDNKWLLVYGNKFTTRGLMSSNHVWAISLGTERVFPAVGLKSLTSECVTDGISLPPITTEPAEVFFDRQIFTRLAK